MRPKISLKQILLVIVFAGSAVSIWLFFNFISKRSVKIVAAPAIENSDYSLRQNRVTSEKYSDIPVGKPIRLKIPEIELDSALGYVGITPDGAMDIPKNQDDVVWLEIGPRPGENGSAVIAGHYGWKDGKGSAFDDLHKLRAGDRLFVEDDKNETISFVVNKIRRYGAEADASAVFVSDDGKAHLNLVTCEGDWNEAAGTYSQRLVIFTDKE